MTVNVRYIAWLVRRLPANGHNSPLVFVQIGKGTSCPSAPRGTII